METTVRDRVEVLDDLDSAGETLDFVVHEINVPKGRVQLALKGLIRDGLVTKDLAFPDQYSTEKPPVRYILTVKGRDAQSLLRGSN